MAHSKALYRVGLGLGTRLLQLSARPGKQNESSPTLPMGVLYLGHTLGQALPPSSPFSAASRGGRAVQIPGLCQMPPPAPCLPPSRLGAGGSTYTCRSGYCITYMSPGLRTARPCSPVRTAPPGPCLPQGSCYPNNNTQSPGTSMEWGRGAWAAIPRALHLLRPRKQRLEPSPGHWRKRGLERLRTD